MSLSDEIAKCVTEKFDKLSGRGKPQGREWTVLAGVVAAFPKEAGYDLEVVCMATGTRCCGFGRIDDNETVLHDCHAEALTRRLLRRVLLHEMLLDCHNEPKPKKLLTHIKGSGDKWKLAVDLHFYVSHLPCGEATQVEDPDFLGSAKKVQRELKDGEVLSSQNRTGAKVLECCHEDSAVGSGEQQTGKLRLKSGRSDLPDHMKTLSWSCTDKIQRWNALGWEGGFLSPFFQEPLRPKSIVIGGCLFGQKTVEGCLKPYEGTSIAHTKIEFDLSRESVQQALEVSGQTEVTSGLSLLWAHTDSMPQNVFKWDGAPGKDFHDSVNSAEGIRAGVKKKRKRSELEGADNIPDASSKQTCILSRACWSRDISLLLKKLKPQLACEPVMYNDLKEEVMSAGRRERLRELLDRERFVGWRPKGPPAGRFKVIFKDDV